MPRFLPGLLLAAMACQKPAPDRLTTGTWVDLTHDFSSETIYWPTAKPFLLEVVTAGQTPGGYYYAANNFSAAEHGGTHLDAPVHFAEGKHTTDQIPLEQLIGPGVIVDVTRAVSEDPDHRIGFYALKRWENTHGRLPEGAIVLFRTGWGAKWPDRQAYLGTSKTGAAAVADLHFPGIDSATARWMVEKRNVAAVGIDTPSIDYGQSTTFDTHRILFAANIPAFENVANLDQLPEDGTFIIALPMKIKGGTGGPLRIVALKPAQNKAR